MIKFHQNTFNMTPIISIIVAAYNVEGCIGRALDSVLSQTFDAFEVIVVDDASTDGTVAYVHGRSVEDPRISVIRQPQNQGPAAARNVGLNAAKGEWVAILDADDAYEPFRLSYLLEVAVSGKADIVADNLELFDVGVGRSTGVALPALAPKDTIVVGLESYLENCIVGVSDFDYGQLKPLMRRSFLLEHSISYPKGLRHGEDFMLYAEILIAGGTFLITGRPGYIFTQRHGSESGKASPFSRTQLSFDSMLDYTVAMMHRPEVNTQPKIVSLLKKRARAIRWHESNTLVTEYARKKQSMHILKAAVSNWRTSVVVAQRALRRLKRVS